MTTSEVVHGIVVAICTTLALGSAGLEAQVVTPPPPAGTFTLTGSVVAAATDTPVPFTSVTLDPIGRERFTDGTGIFRYYALPPGHYKVRLRQIGFIPVDSTVTVAGNANLVFSLVRVPSTLADVEVKAPIRKCYVPDENGFVGDSDLTIVLAEARKNAQRERLLRRSYPFEYKLAQSHDTYDSRDNAHRIVYDTIIFRSDDYWKYRKGKVVSEDRNKLFGDVRVMRLPTLADFSDDRFMAAHCFKYSGISDENGSPAHEIDFSPVKEIVTPDVEGSIYIDSATYIIRRAEFRLTRGGSIKPAVVGMTVTTTYREILPNVALFDEIRSVQPLPGSAPGTPSVEFRQTQHLLSYRFLYNAPSGSGPSLVWKTPPREPAAVSTATAAAESPSPPVQTNHSPPPPAPTVKAKPPAPKRVVPKKKLPPGKHLM